MTWITEAIELGHFWFKTSTLLLLSEGKFLIDDFIWYFPLLSIFTFISYKTLMLRSFSLDNRVVPRTLSVVPRQNSNPTTIGRLVLKYLYWLVKHTVRFVLHQSDRLEYTSIDFCCCNIIILSQWTFSWLILKSCY